MKDTATGSPTNALVDVRYQSMCRAIAECHAVDEVKDLRDKARALEIYTRQAKNREAEDRAREIRLRAEYRAGELMLKAIKAEGTRKQLRGRDSSGGVMMLPPENHAATFAAQGISKRQATDWQAMATVPEEAFEKALRDPEQRLTTASMVKLAKPAPVLSRTTMNGATKIEHDTLMLHAFVRDFERKGYVAKNPADLYGGMIEVMQADFRRIVPTMLEWFARLPFMQEKNRE